jgi:hypothetical protein
MKEKPTVETKQDECRIHLPWVYAQARHSKPLQTTGTRSSKSKMNAENIYPGFMPRGDIQSHNKHLSTRSS